MIHDNQEAGGSQEPPGKKLITGGANALFGVSCRITRRNSHRDGCGRFGATHAAGTAIVPSKVAFVPVHARPSPVGLRFLILRNQSRSVGRVLNDVSLTFNFFTRIIGIIPSPFSASEFALFQKFSHAIWNINHRDRLTEFLAV